MKRFLGLFLVGVLGLGAAYLVWANPGGEWTICVRYNCRTVDPLAASGWKPQCAKINDPSNVCRDTCPDTTDTTCYVYWDVDLTGGCAQDSYMVWATKGAASTDTARIDWDDASVVLCAPSWP